MSIQAIAPVLSSTSIAILSSILCLLSTVFMLLNLFAADQLLDRVGPSIAFGLTWGIFLSSFALLIIKKSPESKFSKSRLGSWIATIILCTFYIAVYFYPQWIHGWVVLLTPLSKLISHQPADHWFLYSFLYTYAVLLFGYTAFKKYKDSRYHKIRTLSLMFFQLAFAFLIPGLLKRAHLPDFYFTYFWPLKPDYLLPFDYIMNKESGLISAEVNGLAVGRAMLLWGGMMSLIATPILTYYFGKRWYCSWVCGCGALAETFGDLWRTQTPKGRKIWQIERYLVHFSLLITIGVTALLWVNEAQGRTLLGEDGSQW